MERIQQHRISKIHADRNDYATSIKSMHWLIAVIVILMLCVSFFIKDLPKDYQGLAFMIHKSFGLTVLFLMLIRILLVLFHGRPQLPPSVPPWQRYAARIVQYMLYLFVLAMPITGWVMSVAANKTPKYFGLFYANLPIDPNKPLAKLMNQYHKQLAWVLIAFICLHILGALKHAFIDKDKVLYRMLPGKVYNR